MRRLTCAIGLAWAVRAGAALVSCDDGGADAPEVSSALASLRTAIDPCGESSDVMSVLEGLESCPRATYRICVDRSAPRNTFDRPTAAHPIGTIIWNPLLRTELAPGPARRDPTASLLHELAHARHDCAGLDAGRLELEAVRVENVYRRAVGLEQRTGYGDDVLPSSLIPDAHTCAVDTQRQAVPMLIHSPSLHR